MAYITRLAKPHREGKLIAGVDLGGVFKDGHVYAFTKVGGIIMCEDLGEQAETPKILRMAKFSAIMHDGTYLLTKPEDKAQGKREVDSDLVY